MNGPDYETSLNTYLQHKRSKWEKNDDLFKKDMIEFMLSMEKKKIEQNCYYLPECLEKENLPMKFKKDDDVSTDDNIQVWWKEILNNYNNEKYGILSGIPLSQPQPLTIWKAKLRNKGDLRFCGADFCLGFINNDNNQDLEIEVVEDDLLGNKIKTIFSAQPHQRTKLTKPILFCRDRFKEFKAYPSHYNFSVLYAWFPKQILNTKDIPELSMEPTPSNNTESNETKIQEFWKEIMTHYKNEKYGILTTMPNTTNPGSLQIWKVKSVKYRNNLRACDADFCLGFINNDDDNLEIDVIEDVSGTQVITHYSLKKNERTQWKTPIWLSKDKFTEFKINADRSHENFYVLYAWLPQKLENMEKLDAVNLKME